MKNKIFLLLTLILAAAMLASCSKSSKNDGTLVIRYGYQAGHSTIVIARDKGFIDEEFGADGIKFNFSKFASGPALVTAITSSSLDYGQVGDQPAVAAKANGVDIKAVGSFLWSDEINGLIALKNSGITQLADVKGRKVGVTVGSTGHHLLYEFLEASGLTPDDIQQVNLAPGDIVSALVSGNVDAAVTWEPYISLTVTQDVTNLVATSGGYSREIDFIIADNAFLQKYPDITPRLLKALDKARLWADANKEEALKIVAADAGIDPSVLAPIFYKINTEVSIPEENIGWTTRTRDFLKKYKLIEDDVDINDLIDLSYLQKAGLQ